MIQRRPILCATAPVVPEPANESRTQQVLLKHYCKFGLVLVALGLLQEAKRPKPVVEDGDGPAKKKEEQFEDDRVTIFRCRVGSWQSSFRWSVTWPPPPPSWSHDTHSPATNRRRDNRMPQPVQLHPWGPVCSGSRHKPKSQMLCKPRCLTLQFRLQGRPDGFAVTVNELSVVPLVFPPMPSHAPQVVVAAEAV